jgi:hypothetical protein
MPKFPMTPFTAVHPREPGSRKVTDELSDFSRHGAIESELWALFQSALAEKRHSSHHRQRDSERFVFRSAWDHEAGLSPPDQRVTLSNESRASHLFDVKKT